MSKKIEVEESSGNIFADIGLPSAGERLFKADLATRVTEAIRARRLTQTRAARILKIDQPKISRLLRGQLSGFSTERLMHFLILLGQDIEISVKPAPRSRREGRLRVMATNGGHTELARHAIGRIRELRKGNKLAGLRTKRPYSRRP